MSVHTCQATNKPRHLADRLNQDNYAFADLQQRPVPALPPLKTIAQVRDELDQAGISLAQWCRDNQVDYQAARDLMTGRSKGRRNLSHNVAIKMGLKRGQLINIQEPL